MWAWVDHLGVLVVNAGVSALVLWALASLAMLSSRQPARRLWIARAAALGSLAFLPLIGFELVPRYDLIAVFQESWGIASPAIPQESGVMVGLVRVLILAYVGALLGGLGWLALGHLALARMVRESWPSSPETAALLDSLPFPESRRRPDVRVAPRVRRPALVGLSRPLILIPPALDQPLAGDRLRLSLLHELAHAEARDTWSVLLDNLARVLWFFVPPFWWVASQARLDQEFLADRRAAQAYGPAPTYASSLLDLAIGGIEGTRPVAPGRDVVSAGSGGAHLVPRVLMLVRCPFPVEPVPPVWWARGVPGFAILITLAVSTLKVNHSDPLPVDHQRMIFRMSRLDIPRSGAGRGERGPAVELPVPLPDRFDLKVEIWGNPTALAGVRVAGLTLPALPVRANPAPNPEPPRWHRVELDRAACGTLLQIDGHPVSLRSRTTLLSHWLSLEPPSGRDASFQNLTLAW